ncbi:hypothetical protein HDU90_003894 [Geranomyces variabilis]|nr:hypothetical protein HDU90_003894 [Geranomyces variabilis]
MSSSKRKFQAVAARSSAWTPSDRQRSTRGAVLDDAARRRAQQQHIEELQQENFNEASTVVDLTAADTDNLSAAARRKRGGLADDDGMAVGGPRSHQTLSPAKLTVSGQFKWEIII